MNPLLSSPRLRVASSPHRPSPRPPFPPSPLPPFSASPRLSSPRLPPSSPPPSPGGAKLSPTVVVQLDRSRRHVFFEMVHSRGARNRKHHRRPPQQPRERKLRRCYPNSSGGSPHRAFLRCKLARRKRKPRDESYARF